MKTPKMVVFVVKRYAVREAEKWRYAVRKAKIRRYAVRQGGGGATIMFKYMRSHSTNLFIHTNREAAIVTYVLVSLLEQHEHNQHVTTLCYSNSISLCKKYGHRRKHKQILLS